MFRLYRGQHPNYIPGVKSFLMTLRPCRDCAPGAFLKTTLLCLSAVIVVLLLGRVDSGVAWEFNMHGETAIRTRYLARTGDRDIFGSMSSDTVHLGINHIKNYPTPAPSNRHDGLRGILAGEPGFGSDANMQEFRSTLYPSLRVNKAVELTGSVNLTSLGVHAGGRPYDNAATGTIPADTGGFQNSLWVPVNIRPAGVNVPNTLVTVQWWRLSAELPLFNISVGMKPSNFGMGLVYNQDQYSSTSVSLSARYGPFTISQSFYRNRTGSGWNVFARDSINPRNPWRKDSGRSYGNTINFGLTYESSPITFALSVDSYRVLAYSGNYGSRNADGTPGPRPVGRAPSPDQLEYDMYAALKYFDGRLFFNTEAVHIGHYRSGRGIANDAGTRVLQNQDVNAWVYGVETGLITGPAKIAVCYVRATGDDPTTRITSEDATDGDPVSPVFMKPWGYLMYWTYGTGTAFGPGGMGQVSNCHHMGIRIDYAVAANLNAFGVFSKARRDQPGAFCLAGNELHTQRRFTNDDLLAAQSGSSVLPVPASADDIGWEANAGFQWRLLENVTWSAVFAYWQPGDWWSHAYPNTAAIYAQTAPGAVPVTRTHAARLMPDRSIDALIGFESVLTVDF